VSVSRASGCLTRQRGIPARTGSAGVSSAVARASSPSPVRPERKALLAFSLQPSRSVPSPRLLVRKEQLSTPTLQLPCRISCGTTRAVLSRRAGRSRPALSSLVEIQAHNLFAPANRGRWMVKSGLGKAAKQPRSPFPAFHAFGPVAQRLEQGTHNPFWASWHHCASDGKIMKISSVHAGFSMFAFGTNGQPSARIYKTN